MTKPLADTSQRAIDRKHELLKQTEHPTETELSAFALGDLPRELAEQVERHVSDCNACCETIVSLSSDDTFLELLQQARANSRDSMDTAAASKSTESAVEVSQPLQSHPRYEIEKLIANATQVIGIRPGKFFETNVSPV